MFSWLFLGHWGHLGLHWEPHTVQVSTCVVWPRVFLGGHLTPSAVYSADSSGFIMTGPRALTAHTLLLKLNPCFYFHQGAAVSIRLLKDQWESTAQRVSEVSRFLNKERTPQPKIRSLGLYYCRQCLLYFTISQIWAHLGSEKGLIHHWTCFCHKNPTPVSKEPHSFLNQFSITLFIPKLKDWGNVLSCSSLTSDKHCWKLKAQMVHVVQ